ncbi:MAG: hypothetical protein DRG11_07570 [Epsilonproteobacteria bacterium]|nr:MAG: hypothetical protein DRG11_07570 [Campylobacterota bacterium]
MRWYNYLLTGMFFLVLTACHKTPQLPEPELMVKDVNVSKPKAKKTALRFPDNLHIKGLKKASDRQLLMSAYKFLYDSFGAPRYTGDVHIVVTNENIPYPSVSWQAGRESQRTLTLSRFYMYKSELPTIVHELFHALYQSNNIINLYPEFILEGMAIYVENLFKYKKHAKVKQTLQQLMQNDQICRKIDGIQFNASFQIHNANMVYFLYITGGDFFAAQDEDATIQIIKMIDYDKKEKMSIADVMDRLNLQYFPCGLKKDVILQRYRKVNHIEDNATTAILAPTDSSSSAKE